MTIPRWRLALTAGALVVLGAVGGGFVQAAAAPPATAADVVATEAADNAVLLDTVALLSDPTSSGTALPAQLVALRGRLEARFANIRGHLVHGSLTVLDRDGKLATYQLDHGTVSAVGGGSITIAEAGGSSVTVSTTTATHVRKGAKASTLADLKVGDEVVVRSTVVAGTATATHIVVPPAAPAATAPSSAGNG